MLVGLALVTVGLDLPSLRTVRAVVPTRATSCGRTVYRSRPRGGPIPHEFLPVEGEAIVVPDVRGPGLRAAGTRENRHAMAAQ